VRIGSGCSLNLFVAAAKHLTARNRRECSGGWGGGEFCSPPQKANSLLPPKQLKWLQSVPCSLSDKLRAVVRSLRVRVCLGVLLDSNAMLGTTGYLLVRPDLLGLVYL